MCKYLIQMVPEIVLYRQKCATQKSERDERENGLNEAFLKNDYELLSNGETEEMWHFNQARHPLLQYCPELSSKTCALEEMKAMLQNTYSKQVIGLSWYLDFFRRWHNFLVSSLTDGMIWLAMSMKASWKYRTCNMWFE